MPYLNPKHSSPTRDMTKCPKCGSENLKDMDRVYDLTRRLIFRRCKDCNADFRVAKGKIIIMRKRKC